MKRNLESSQPQPQPQPQSQLRHAPGSVRFLEKRRTGTCQFADRVAKISIDKYKSSVPASFRENQKQTCIATIVAHLPASLIKDEESRLQVMSLGVGTKFLPEKMLREAENSAAPDESSLTSKSYGSSVRDCHAEVLARRAFRRQLCLEIQEDIMNSLKNSKVLRGQQSEDEAPPLNHPILERVVEGENIRYRLLPGVTLHMYTSSAPCGNATLKKFTKMEKEKYNEKLGPDEWPTSNHEPIPPHSLRLGQFALLTKKDNSQTEKGTPPKSNKQKDEESRNDNIVCHPIDTPIKGKVWPANQSDEWCPPGTSIVSFDKGSLHSCSDKLCRWNYLGLQGGLVASLLDSPLYIETLTVGRKFTECICRRAVCCRAVPPKKFKPVDGVSMYSLKHPSIMGTAVYMDESGLIDMSNSTEFGQDVRFNSTLCWCWWASLNAKDAECVDGATGLAKHYADEETQNYRISMVSTLSLLQLFSGTASLLPQYNGKIKNLEKSKLTLEDLRCFKRHISPEYESAKDTLLTKHRVFRQWRRRESEGNGGEEAK